MSHVVDAVSANTSQEAVMSRTLGELAIAIVVLVLCYRLGLELAPMIMDWWRGLRSAGQDDIERNDHEQR